MVEADVKPDSKPDPGPGRQYSADEFKEVVAARDEVKRKLRDFEEAQKKAADEKAVKDGEFKTLAEARQKELDELKAAKEKDAETSKTISEELKALKKEKEARRKALLEKLPKEDQEVFGELNEAQLQVLIDKQETKSPTRPAKPGEAGSHKSLEDFTPLELSEMAATQPTEYNRLIQERLKKNRTAA